MPLDAYDHAVVHLTANPHLILDAWNEPPTAPGGILFNYAGPPASPHTHHNLIGCLTQIRLAALDPKYDQWGSPQWRAATPALTAAIRADTRIPTSPHSITPADLPVFAEWQRKLDAALDRPAPTWQDPSTSTSTPKD